MSRQPGSDDGARPPGDGDRPDERPRDLSAELPDIPASWGPVIIPDDPRELAEEAAQVRAELEREARDHPRSGRGWFRGALSGPLIALVLFLVAAVASLMVVVLPKPPRLPRQAPLARPSAPAGTVGGLLPQVALAQPGRPRVTLREFRPAVLVIAPATCRNCLQLWESMAVMTAEMRLTVVWVTEADRAATPPERVDMGRTISFADPNGTFRRNVAGASATGPTAILVRADGVIHRITTDLDTPGQLRPELAVLPIS